MQNSGVIKFLTIVLVVVCVYELSFTFKSRSVAQEMRDQANGSASKYRELVKAKENEVVFNLIGAEYTYKECQEREINLGLDLRGGVSVTLEIALENLVQQNAGPNVDKPDFKKVLAAAKELKFKSQDNFVEVFYQAYLKLKAENEIQSSFLSLFKNRNNSDLLADGATDDDVNKYLSEYADQAIDESFKVLRTRVAQFGIAQPSIKRIGNTGRIMVDLPGVEDIERVKKVLQGSAQLEFWDTYSVGELREGLFLSDKEANTLELVKKENNESAAASNPSPEKAKQTTSDINSIVNLGNTDSTKTVATDSSSEQSAQDAAINHPLLTLLHWESKLQGLVLSSDTGKVHEYLALGKAKGLLPRNLEVGWSNDAEEVEGKNYHIIWFLRGGREDGAAGLKGDVIKRAVAENDQTSGAPVVSLDFNATGISDWANMTKVSFETGRPIAIVMDGLVFSAPVARGIINEGRTQISGGADKNPNWNFDLATVLNAGRFPAPVHIVEEAYVGPSLGKEAIQAGVMSFIIAILLVLLYMAFYYGQAGWIANVALFVNMFLVAGVLAAFPTVSLTLPGIAGIVLTVGMSVDANVLIFERIREELRAGKGLKLAIEDGYKHALTAIIDSNLTTLITGIILWYFGSGVVEGFAQTLVIGILTSLFAAIYVSRLVFQMLLKKDRVLSFGTKLTNTFLVGVKYKIMENRKKGYVISAIIITVALISFATRGFDFGVDFTGGRSYTVRLEKASPVDELAASVSAFFVDADGKKLTPEVKQYGEENQFAITTKYLYDVPGDSASTVVQMALYNGLKAYIPADMTYQDFISDNENKTVGIMNANVVGAEIADDIKVSAMWAVSLSLLAIFFYVAFRFRKWSFGLGALVSLFHDMIIVMACFSLLYGMLPFSLEVNQHFIAAILTVLGYSINDTVVVFDRIREYKGIFPKKDPVSLANEALNSTFGRTINTSMTIFVVLLAIFIFGGETIRGFSFALLIGIIVGTYSSLFVATPIFVDLELKSNKKKND